MSKDRGFRDVNFLRLRNECYIYWRRARDGKEEANAFTARASEARFRVLLERATQADLRHRRRRIGHEPRNYPLRGFTFAIKDNIATNDLPTTCASKMLEGFLPTENATVVKQIVNQGGLIVGKTNMDEFGMGSHSTHSAHGPVLNGPEPFALSAGGSSGGSAMAVAKKMCHIALGTDTGGSIRLPAAYTGLIGFKPSYGILSRLGVVPYANSLDTVGILARNCLDVFLTFQALTEPDVNDPTNVTALTRQRRLHPARNVRRGVPTKQNPFRVVPLTSSDAFDQQYKEPWRKFTYPSAAPSDTYKRRIGFPIEYNIEELDPSVRKAWIRALSILEHAGHEVVPISLPSTKAALSAYYVLAPAEASSNLAKYDGIRYGVKPELPHEFAGSLFSTYRGDNFGDEVKRRILLGAFSLSADAIDNYFIQAQRVRRLVQQDFDMVFRMKNPLHDKVKPNPEGVDVIVCPTAPTPPPRLSKLKEQTPLDAYMNDVFTVPASLAGLPAISIPMLPEAGTDYVPERMIGLQLIGQYGDDFEVIQFAKREFEARENWEDIYRAKENARLK